MDFDDLDDAEAAAGPTPEERAEQLMAQECVDGRWRFGDAVPPQQEFPAPPGKNFGAGGKMKMLFMYGGGVNSKVGKLQAVSVFKEMPFFKELELEVFEAPTATHLSWHPPEMQEQMRPYGEDIYLYFDRIPYANAQNETWEGVELTWKSLAEHFKKNGPYDGVVGFDMGAECLVHVARMAQEGHPDFQHCFRFMIMFTCSSSRWNSRLGKEGKRPKAQLRVPSVISWCYGDANHPYPCFEESALFWEAGFREVITHQDGHVPGKFKKGTQEFDRIVAFLEAMREGKKFTPSDHPDNAWCSKLFLPIARVQPEKIPAGVTRRLIVLHDPMGSHDYEAQVKVLAAAVQAGHMPPPSEGVLFKKMGFQDVVEDALTNFRLGTVKAEAFQEAAGGDVKVEGVTYTDAMLGFNAPLGLHCRDDQIPSRQLKKEDCILEEQHEMLAREWAAELTSSFVLEEDERVGIVGIGTGAFLALALAKVFVQERRKVPAGLWVVDPPTRLPHETTRKPGQLVDCPVGVLTHASSMIGPPWRWEVSTAGPFSHTLFSDLDDAVKQIVEEYKAL